MDTKIIGLIAFLITFTGAIIAAENHYARAAEMEERLEQKADAKDVALLQEQLLRDKMEEIEYDIFVIESQDEQSELDEYRLKKLYSRLEELQKLIN